MSHLAPVLNPLTTAAYRGWLHLHLAYVRWALREIHPLNPDRHVLEGRKAKLERELA